MQDRGSIAAAIDAGIARFGAIDALVNNAGFGLFGMFESTPRVKIQEQFDVNVFGLMDVTRALLPHFRARGAGALEGFSDSLSCELRALSIAMRIVEPGGVLDTGSPSARRTRPAPRRRRPMPAS